LIKWLNYFHFKLIVKVDTFKASKLVGKGAEQLLRNAKALQILSVLCKDSATVQGLTQQLNLPMPTVHRLVKRLVAEGVLCVSDVQTRAGRAVNWYAATAQVFLFLWK
jgi:DNA-binding MarR family transcriptional regulator